jgi:hypothetical protein
MTDPEGLARERRWRGWGGVTGEFTVVTWNTRWATLASPAGPRVAARLHASGADIIVVTEGARDLLPATGHLVDAGTDWGYPVPNPVRRKVILWSRRPLSDVAVGTVGATRGRFVAATTETPAGQVRVHGVCIPWRDAHVKGGRGDANPWSEHLEFLDILGDVLSADSPVPAVVAGDFNQRIPKGSQPVRVAHRMSATLRHMTVHTAGAHPHGPYIDHIATNTSLRGVEVDGWAASDLEGPLSDHAGVRCRLSKSRAESSTAPECPPRTGA